MVVVVVVSGGGGGQTTEAFWVSLSHAKPLCFGLNCALVSNSGKLRLCAKLRREATLGVTGRSDALSFESQLLKKSAQVEGGDL